MPSRPTPEQLSATIAAALQAAQAADADAFAAALTQLNRADADQVSVLLGTITRELLERSAPDGLESEDAELILQSAIRSAVAWYDGLNSDALIRALTGALGLTESEETPTADHGVLRAHGLILIADRLTALKLRSQPVLASALRELERAQTIELP